MRMSRDGWTAVAMLAPSVVLLGIFVYGFIGATVWTSISDWGRDPAQALARDPLVRFAGLVNYRELFTGIVDVRFRQDLVNLAFFTVFFLGGSLSIGLLLAFLLDQDVRGEGFFRTLFLFPMSLSFVVTGTAWRWMLQPRGGVNVLPTTVGLEPLTLRWLTDRTQLLRFDWNDLPAIGAGLVGAAFATIAVTWWIRNARRKAALAAAVALVAGGWAATGGRDVALLPYRELHGFNVAFVGIVLAAVWQMSGYVMALYLAGLRGIPRELREAANVDGASEVQTYRFVILPLLRPITLSAAIVLGHVSLKAFDLIFAMAGADNATTDVPALLMYLTAFRANQFSKGAAIATILFLLVAAVVVPYLWTTLRADKRR